MEKTVSDLELYNGLKQGERNAIVMIYDQLLPRVTKWVLQNNGTEADANDIFQETLETILLKVDRIHISFEGLVLTMSKNKWVDRLRKQSTKNKIKDQIAFTSEQELFLFTTEDELRETEYYKYILMEKYFNLLSETCQKVMSLLKSGVSVEDIVSRLALSSANTLYRRKAACIERWAVLVKQDPNYKEIYR